LTCPTGERLPDLSGLGLVAGDRRQAWLVTDCPSCPAGLGLGSRRTKKRSPHPVRTYDLPELVTDCLPELLTCPTGERLPDLSGRPWPCQAPSSGRSLDHRAVTCPMRTSQRPARAGERLPDLSGLGLVAGDRRQAWGF